MVKTLRENFTEKKAMAALYKLEKITIELVKLNREIVALANKFDERWLQKNLFRQLPLRSFGLQRRKDKQGERQVARHQQNLQRRNRDCQHTPCV